MKQKKMRLLLIILGLIVSLFLLLPVIIKKYTINHSKELIGRQVYLDKLKLNYFTGTLKAYNFRMLEQNEKQNFLTFDTLIINLEPLKLVSNKIEIEQFYIQGLEVNVTMKDSAFNFKDLVEFYTTKSDSLPKNSATKEPFKYSISNLELNNANFHFNNQDIDHITNLNNISFMVPFIGWDQKKKSNATVAFNFPKGGYFETKLNINPINGNYDADLVIQDLHIDSFYKYVAEYANINAIEGVINSTIHVEGNTNEAVKSIVSGNINLVDFALTDTFNKKFIAAKKTAVAIKRFDYYHNSYIVDTLNIDESYTFFKLDSLTNNFYEIFDLSSETKTATQQKNLDEESPLYYAINHLNVSKGILDYTDNLTGKPFEYHLSSIAINSDSIVSDSDWLTINSDMILNNRGSLKAELGFNPITLNDINLDFVIENFLLSDVNIYTNHYTGHDILEGDMYYYSNSKIIAGNIESENKLLVKNVSLNSTSKGLYSLPLKFALFLLKDKNGDVNLDVPVQGDLNNPTVNVRKIVWNTFKNLIVKAVSSPGRLLAGIVGGDPKDIEEITFSYLDTTLTEKSKRQLDKLLELEDKKQGLGIELNYLIDTQLQKEALAEKEAGAIYFRETTKDYLKNEKDFNDYVWTKTNLDSVNLKEAYVSLVTPKAVDSIALSTTQILIAEVKRYLSTSKDSTKISVQMADPKAPENKGAYPTFKIKYSMQNNE